MTYQESSDLMNDFQFRGRIKVAALGFAKYVFGEAPNTEAHNTRYKYAQQIYQMPEAVAAQLHPPVVMEDAVQQAGADITDTALQTVVETVIGRLI